MIDCMGEELHIGDEVVVAQTRTDRLFIGKIVGFTTKTVKIEMTTAGGYDDDATIISKHPYRLIKRTLPSDELFSANEIKEYLKRCADEWNELGDRKYELANMQVYNHVMKCLDDLNDALEERSKCHVVRPKITYAKSHKKQP